MDRKFWREYDARLLLSMLHPNDDSAVNLVGDDDSIKRLGKALQSASASSDYRYNSALPASASVVYFTLERLAYDRLTDFLESLAGQPCVFFIDTHASAFLADDGLAQNRTLLSESGWLERIRKTFVQAIALPSARAGVVVISTMIPSSATLITICKLRRQWLYQQRQRAFKRRIYNALESIIRRPVSEERLRRDVQDKRIALVGNAQSLNDKNHGAAIDSADIVIRCNRGPRWSAASHGLRTDWLCTALSIQRPSADRLGANLILWMGRRQRPMRYVPRWMIRERRVHFYSRLRGYRLERRLGHHPSTGLKAIDLLTRWPIQSLELYGFDFFSTTSLSNTPAEQFIDHDWAAERDYVLALCRSTGVVSLHD